MAGLFLTRTDVIVMGEKRFNWPDYYMNSDSFRPQGGDYDSRVNPWMHGLRLGSNYLLLDVHVGTGDGFRVLEGLRGERVALFTGSFQVDKQRAATVDAVLRKPFTLTELSETVGRLASGSPLS